MSDLTKIFHNILGNSFFGSKSGYRMKNPNSDPYFNSFVLVQHEDMSYEEVWRGDIDLHNQETIAKLKTILNQIKKPIFLYRESTVHNRTFNGYPFPYEQYDCKIFLVNNNSIMEKNT